MMTFVPTLAPPEMVQKVSSPSVSGESIILLRNLKDVAEHLEETVSKSKGALFSALAEISSECATPDWDGQGAKAIGESAFRDARLLINQLPHTVLLPDISPSPSGGLIFEWRRGSDDVFILAVSGNQKIAYAAIISESTRINVTEKFFGTFPQRVEALLGENFRSGV